MIVCVPRVPNLEKYCVAVGEDTSQLFINNKNIKLGFNLGNTSELLFPMSGNCQFGSLENKVCQLKLSIGDVQGFEM